MNESSATLISKARLFGDYFEFDVYTEEKHEKRTAAIAAFNNNFVVAVPPGINSLRTILQGSVSINLKIHQRMMAHDYKSVNLTILGGEDLTTLEDAFKELYDIDVLDLSRTESHKIKVMDRAFKNIRVKTIKFGDLDFNKVKSIVGAFEQAHIDELDLSSMESEVKFKASSIFRLANIKKLKINNGAFKNCDYLDGAFECVEIDELDITGMNVSTVTNVEGLFDGARITSMVGYDTLSFEKVDRIVGMFQKFKCDKLDVSNICTDRVLSLDYMFLGFEGEITGIEQWNTSLVESMCSVFEDAKIRNIDVSGLNFSRVTNITGMFSGIIADTVKMNNITFPSVAYAKGIFENSKIRELYFNNNTFHILDKLIDTFSRMENNILHIENLQAEVLIALDCTFTKIKSDTGIDISTWVIPNLVWFDTTFTYADVPYINLSNLKLDKLVTIKNLFNYCTTMSDNIKFEGFEAKYLIIFLHSFMELHGEKLDMSWLVGERLEQTLALFKKCHVKNIDLTNFKPQEAYRLRTDQMFDSCESMVNTVAGELDARDFTITNTLMNAVEKVLRDERLRLIQGEET